MPRSLARSLVAAAALACTVAAPLIGQGPDPNRYIVKFKESRFAQGKQALRGVGARIDLDLDRHGAAAAIIPPKALEAMRNNPNVEYVEQDVPRYLLSETEPYGISLVQADQVSDAFAGNTTVCIIDSGFDAGHEDLPSNVTGSDDPGGSGLWDVDTNGHGTHVAGTIAAQSNSVGVVGVLPNDYLNLHIVKVFDENGWAYSSSLVGALDVCEANSGGRNLVVSMSLGGTFKSRTEEKAFDQAYARGVLSIAAAGNDGNTRKSYPASYASVVSVAAVDEHLNVASFSQQNDQVEIAAPGVGVLSTVPMGSGSETTVTVGGSDVAAEPMDGSPNGSGSGPLVDCGIGDSTCAGATGAVCLIQRGSISFADKVLACQNGGGVAAIIYNNEPGMLYGTLGETATTIPSVGISDTDGAALAGQLGAGATVSLEPGNYAAWDGTSMATPHVSGVAALVWSQDETCTNQNIRDLLDTTAMDIAPSGRDNATGYGLVQAGDAVAMIDIFCTGGGGDGGGDGGGGSCENLLPSGASCSSNSECCSGNCKGKPGSQTCK